MNKNINLKPLIDITKLWTCEKCQNVNLYIDYRCLRCNYFNYDIYAYSLKKESTKKKTKIKNDSAPIILNSQNIDYNFKEDYEFKREEKHKFTKCWKCGRENIYYKVKCNYCRFPINDSKVSHIKKTQLTEYDLLHGITLDDYYKPEKNESEKIEYKEIKNRCNPLKEELENKNLDKSWKCKLCQKDNKKSDKFCIFCFNNRF